MPRPVSWLPRLHLLRRAVQGSARSHYTRHDLEQLFELQPRAAQNLISLLPSVAIGQNRLVEREALDRFLTGVHEAEDVPAFLEQLRQQKKQVSHRRLRSLVRADLPPVSLDALPDALTFSPGKLEVHFRSLEDLAEALLHVARLLEQQGDTLAQAFELREETPESENALDDAAEIRRMFQELEAWEQKSTPA